MLPFNLGNELLDLMLITGTLLQPVLKKVVNASGAVDYNVLQNNGTIAHQEVPHVCCSTSISYYIPILIRENRCISTWYTAFHQPLSARPTR